MGCDYGQIESCHGNDRQPLPIQAHVTSGDICPLATPSQPPQFYWLSVECVSAWRVVWTKSPVQVSS